MVFSDSLNFTSAIELIIAPIGLKGEIVKSDSNVSDTKIEIEDDDSIRTNSGSDSVISEEKVTIRKSERIKKEDKATNTEPEYFIQANRAESKDNKRVVDTPHVESDIAIRPKVTKEQIHNLKVPIPIEMVRANLDGIKDDFFQRLLVRYSGTDVVPDGWIQGPNGDGVQVVYGSVCDNSWHTMKATGTLPCNSEDALQLLANRDMVPHFDDMTKEIRLLEQLDEHTEVRLVSCKGVMFTTPRDFCVITSVRREDSGRWLVATRSVEYPGSLQDRYTRALSFISGYVITPVRNDPIICEVAIIAHMDLGGHVPAFVVRQLGLSSPIDLIKSIRKVVEKQAKTAKKL
uniref:Uncharacterized protein AlNc14C64G4571 n=1 Tax=Albugo laibachii Nc14 TaxID=890382 RepID=F0WD50_9STRA|nr:conserved hypothetical protein [Albugo laibachii Nc14]|eukprot:CCA19122.1 conserved hypothetical protein [Albugo laibachii Nc14]